MINEEDKIPFMAHLEELRDRIIKSSIAVVICFIPAYGFKEKLFEILIFPLVSVMGKGDALIFTGLPEAFFTYLKVAFIAGIMLASPILLYHFWMFVAPGLYNKERRFLIPIIILSVVFFLGGALFAYFIVFPYGFQFFLGFATDKLHAMPSMKEYLSFASTMLLAFGLVFELPLVLTGMAGLGIITPDFLKKNRKYSILIIFIVAAILTPPDVITQVMMAVPLMLLYEVSIVGAMVFGKKTSEDEQEEAENMPEPVKSETADSDNE